MASAPTSPTKIDPGAPGDYELRISPTTVDKLGVKLYDKVSAVVAELLANSYDADAEKVKVIGPLGTQLATKNRGTGQIEQATPPWSIEVSDDGHGMTPGEARSFFLDVGRDRRADPAQGDFSREKRRPVMGRKGIGKLAPFGVCRVIEVQSSGGDPTPDGYYTTHFFLKYDDIMAARTASSDGNESDRVPLETGPNDGRYLPARGTKIVLSEFDSKRVPDRTRFKRQLERRFVVADSDFEVEILDSRRNETFSLEAFDVPMDAGASIDLSNRPVQMYDGTNLPVRGKVGLATEAYQDEEMAGVRIYARGKIIATTRDFEQPAGFTGEFTVRSYLVGEVHADWLDEDDDLIRTDRQDILWSSEKGEALRTWGGELIREIGRLSRGPRRTRTRNSFMRSSEIERLARERFSDESVIDAAVRLGEQIGSFAAEDELQDPDYVRDLSEVILSVAPHRALMVAFTEFSSDVMGGDVRLESLADLFGKTNVAELASYGQIAHERVRAITELEEALRADADSKEERLQEILARAPYLIEPTWSVITKNQSLRTFKSAFEAQWAREHNGEQVELTIDYENKRPDFVLSYVGRKLHIVEIKAPQHSFANADYDRLARYVRAFRRFASEHPGIMQEFSQGWQIDLVVDAVNLTDPDKAESFSSFEEKQEVVPINWYDFLNRARTAHEEFLNAYAKARARR